LLNDDDNNDNDMLKPALKTVCDQQTSITHPDLRYVRLSTLLRFTRASKRFS